LAKSSEQAFILYAKFLFFFLVFAVLYWGTTKIPGMDSRIGATITFIISLISTVMIPGALIKFIYETYAAVIGFTFALMPFFIGLMLSNRVFKGEERHQRIFRGIIWIFMAVVTLALIGTIEQFDDPIYLELAKWLEVAVFVLIIAAAWSLIGSIGGGGEGGGGFFGSGRTSGTGKDGGTPDGEPKRDPKKTSKAAANVAELTAQMSTIDDKVTKLEAIEQQEYYGKLEDYKNQVKLLDEIDNILSGSWNALTKLKNVASQMKSKPEYYEEHKADIESNFTTYGKFVQKLFDLLNKLAQHLSTQLDKDKHIETLGDAYKKIINYLQQISSLDLREARKILKSVHGGSKVKKIADLEAEELREAGLIIDTIKALPRGLRGFDSILNDDTKLKQKLDRMDEEDYNKIKSIIDRMSGLISNFRAAYRSYESAGHAIPSVYALFTKLILPVEDIKVFARDLRLIRQKTIEKIDLTNKHFKDIRNKRLLTDKFKDLETYIQRLDGLLLHQEEEAA